MKRNMDVPIDEPSVAVNILALLPRDVVIHMLKTTHMSIADVFIFCQTNVWSFNLCNDKNVWETIYNVRFSNIDLRRRVDAILAANPEGIVFRAEEYGFAVSLLFGPPLRIGAMFGAPNLEEFVELKNEMTDIINQICGPPDDIEDSIKWSRDLGVLRPIFQKMIIYNLFEYGFTATEPN